MKKPLLLLFLLSYGIIKSQTNDTSKTEKHIEVMPEFPGGPREMMLFIQKNINYPRQALKKNIQGKCFLRFTIMKDGAIDSIRVLKGVDNCPECDAEATRVIKEMPKWKPATIDGKPIPVFFNLPINFTIKNKSD